MGEKCCFDEMMSQFGMKSNTECSRNDGWGNLFPDECDDCDPEQGYYYCSKHLKEHKKNGLCLKIRNTCKVEELKDLEEQKQNIEKRIKSLKEEK